MTDARRVFAEKRRLILPIAIALLVNLALFAIVAVSAVEEGRGWRAGVEAAATALNAARRDFAAARATTWRARGRPTRNCRSSTATSCRQT